mmetsp:Transcript_19422/g.26662  ORF Transcript_19422/g.26662 Transcript_19422/m.26662 type:complete len:90 (+) Transcript_19422:1566-1835(+)
MPKRERNSEPRVVGLMDLEVRNAAVVTFDTPSASRSVTISERDMGRLDVEPDTTWDASTTPVDVMHARANMAKWNFILVQLLCYIDIVK